MSRPASKENVEQNGVGLSSRGRTSSSRTVLTATSFSETSFFAVASASSCNAEIAASASESFDRSALTCSRVQVEAGLTVKPWGVQLAPEGELRTQPTAQGTCFCWCRHRLSLAGASSPVLSPRRLLAVTPAAPSPPPPPPQRSLSWRSSSQVRPSARSTRLVAQRPCAHCRQLARRPPPSPLAGGSMRIACGARLK